MKRGFNSGNGMVLKSPINTTIGDLVCAIADAAYEARVNDRDLAELTHYILQKMIARSRQLQENTVTAAD